MIVLTGPPRAPAGPGDPAGPLSPYKRQVILLNNVVVNI